MLYAHFCTILLLLLGDLLADDATQGGLAIGVQTIFVFVHHIE